MAQRTQTTSRGQKRTRWTPVQCIASPEAYRKFVICRIFEFKVETNKLTGKAIGEREMGTDEVSLTGLKLDNVPNGGTF